MGSSSWAEQSHQSTCRMKIHFHAALLLLVAVVVVVEIGVGVPLSEVVAHLLLEGGALPLRHDGDPHLQGVAALFPHHRGAWSGLCLPLLAVLIDQYLPLLAVLIDQYLPHLAVLIDQYLPHHAGDGTVGLGVGVHNIKITYWSPTQ
jgi:hypothetical protein